MSAAMVTTLQKGPAGCVARGPASTGFSASLLVSLDMGRIMPEAAYLRKVALTSRIQAGPAMIS